jgi:hypothetical protein
MCNELPLIFGNDVIFILVLVLFPALFIHGTMNTRQASIFDGHLVVGMKHLGSRNDPLRH